MSTYLIAAPEALAAASADLNGIAETVGKATASAAPSTTEIAAAAADEVSAAIARMFGGYAQSYQSVGAQIALYQKQFQQTLLSRAGAYAAAEAVNGVDETLLKTIEVFENHPLIADDVTISGWVWEVETRRCGRPLAIRRAGPAPMRRRATTVSPSLNLPAGTWAMVSKTSPPRPTRCAE
ncbi:PE domain-containing protein [Mycobacterium paragordonae]|uniref:PE domain-containing protein n=1 Tax=Mycobacterium paragordonae TaxID=1389713 RepID=A0AAJ1S9Y4_9MYCO|nr:PE domain-containing protein [Mycobacterium paragordonae]MDP7739450.1 PE domain-containing protein [Mycobacterium paragordonae]